jgi:hypothetical protein
MPLRLLAEELACCACGWRYDPGCLTDLVITTNRLTCNGNSTWVHTLFRYRIGSSVSIDLTGAYRVAFAYSGQRIAQIGKKVANATRAT